MARSLVGKKRERSGSNPPETAEHAFLVADPTDASSRSSPETRPSVEGRYLPPDNHNHLDNATHGKPAVTPLPFNVMLSLITERVSELMIYSVIFPYVNEMIHSFGVSESKVGIWSAIAESILILTEAIAAPIYAKVGDRYGRRPMLVTCMFLWSTGGILSGFMWSVWSVLRSRGVLGLFAGAFVAARTICAETCDSTNRYKGFALANAAMTAGAAFGPAIGGLTSSPVPRLFGSTIPEHNSGLTGVFERFPYLMPSCIVGSIGFIATTVSFLYLPETLPPSLLKARDERRRNSTRSFSSVRAAIQKASHILTKARRRRPKSYVPLPVEEHSLSLLGDRSFESQSHDAFSRPGARYIIEDGSSGVADLAKDGRQSRNDDSRPVNGDNQEVDPSTTDINVVQSNEGWAGVGRLLRVKRYRAIIVVYSASSMIMLSLDALFPLMAFTSPELGGMGMSTPTIGAICAVSAGASVVMSIIIFPYMQSRMSEKALLNTCLGCFAISIALLPVTRLCHLATNAATMVANYAPGSSNTSSATSSVETSRTSSLSVLTLLVLALHIFTRRIGDFSLTLFDAAMPDTIPSPELLSLATSLLFGLACFGRVVGPPSIGAAFSLSTQFYPGEKVGNPSDQDGFRPGRYIVWVTMTLMVVLCFHLQQSLHSPKAVQPVVMEDTAVSDREGGYRDQV